MKIIELLNRISNGEEVPKKIKWNNRTYKYVNEYEDYAYDSAYCFFEDDLLKTRILLKRLNDEVEIIEEKQKNKKIEKLDLILDEHFSNDELQAYIKETQEKVNEIIDKINEE